MLTRYTTFNSERLILTGNSRSSLSLVYGVHSFEILVHLEDWALFWQEIGKQLPRPSASWYGRSLKLNQLRAALVVGALSLSAWNIQLACVYIYIYICSSCGSPFFICLKYSASLCVYIYIYALVVGALSLSAWNIQLACVYIYIYICSCCGSPFFICLKYSASLCILWYI
jgi:hypothetical protein